MLGRHMCTPLTLHTPSAEQPAAEEAVPRRGVQGAAQAQEVPQEPERLPQTCQVRKADGEKMRERQTERGDT